MTEQAPPSAESSAKPFDWAGARGDKWRAQLDRMEAMLAPTDAPLIEALRLEGPSRIADIGCGGGGTTFEILRRAPQGSIVHGFDLSPSLIESARERLGGARSAIDFSLADVSTALAPEPPYDRLLSRFGVMFYEDPPLAFRSLVRWLAPGGRFAFAVWGRPSDNAWTSVLKEEASRFVQLPPSDPDAAGPFRYAEAGKLVALLEQAGFAELDVQTWRGVLQLGGGLSPAEAADFALRAFSVGEVVCAAGPEVFARVHESLTARLAAHHENGAVGLGACVQIVTGVRPT